MAVFNGFGRVQELVDWVKSWVGQSMVVSICKSMADKVMSRWRGNAINY